MPTVIRISELCKTYPGTLAVDNLSLEVEYGTIHGFLGPNGAGKSTTMKVLSGLIQPDSGSVKIFENGKEVLREDQSAYIGFLPENPPLYEYMKVIDFLTFVYQIYAKDKKQMKPNVETAIERCGLSDVRKKYISQLSKGYKQRVGIAMAMVHRPKILILDEPFVGLDPIALGELRNVLIELRKDHTILFSSHQLDEVQRLCDNLTVIDQGQGVFNGSLDNFLHGNKKQIEIKVVTIDLKEQFLGELLKEFPKISLKNKEVLGTNVILYLNLPQAEMKVSLSQFFAKKMVPVIEFSEIGSQMESLYQASIDSHKEAANHKEAH